MKWKFSITFISLFGFVTKRCVYNILFKLDTSTYDHRVWKTGLPVRSAVLKPHAGELVVGWVTTSESSLLYVVCIHFFGFVGKFHLAALLRNTLFIYDLVLRHLHYWIVYPTISASPLVLIRKISR
jgi:hypothetical protein